MAIVREDGVQVFGSSSGSFTPGANIADDDLLVIGMTARNSGDPPAASSITYTNAAGTQSQFAEVVTESTGNDPGCALLFLRVSVGSGSTAHVINYSGLSGRSSITYARFSGCDTLALTSISDVGFLSNTSGNTINYTLPTTVSGTTGSSATGGFLAVGYAGTEEEVNWGNPTQSFQQIGGTGFNETGDKHSSGMIYKIGTLATGALPGTSPSQSNAGNAGIQAATFCIREAVAAGAAVSLSASTAGTSTASAALSASQAVALAASTAGTSTASAALAPGILLASSTAGTSTAAAALAPGILLSASTAGTSTASAALTEEAVAISFAATTAGTSTAAAALTPGRGLASSTTGTSIATAALTEEAVAISFAATTAGTSTAAAALTVGIPTVSFAASTTGTSTAAAALTAGRGLASSTAGTSTAAAALTPGILLASSTAGTSTAAAALAPGILLAASTAGTSAASAALTEEAVAISFAAATAGTSTAAAALTPGRGLASSTTGTSIATAALTEEAVAISLAASVAGISTATAALTEDLVGVPFSAAVAGASTVAGAFTPEVLEPLLKLGAKSLIAKTQLSEEITYYPGGDLSAGKTIRAVVERMELDFSDYGDVGSPTLDVELWILTDSTLGVSAVLEGKDLADVVLTEGQPADRVRVTEVVEKDPAMVHLMAVR